jgi:hypothetical protein
VPKGLKLLAKIAEEGRARREAYDAGGDFQRALVLKPGQVATGRFCEEGEDVTYVLVHELPKKPGQSIADKILCLDQDGVGVPCYGCELENVRQSARLVMNFIRYDEPKLVRDDKGKPVKDNFGNYQLEMIQDPGTGQMVVATEMALLIFDTGASAGGRLDFLEDQKGGMTRHVCTIARTHDNTSPYMIDILEANKLPPSPEEVALFNKKIEPLKAITQLGKRKIPALSYGDMIRAYGGSVGSGFAQGGGQGQPPVTPENNYYAKAAQNQADQVTGAGKFNLGAFDS